jgi:hypothetical protein
MIGDGCSCIICIPGAFQGPFFSEDSQEQETKKHLHLVVFLIFNLSRQRRKDANLMPLLCPSNSFAYNEGIHLQLGDIAGLGIE